MILLISVPALACMLLTHFVAQRTGSGAFCPYSQCPLSAPSFPFEMVTPASDCFSNIPPSHPTSRERGTPDRPPRPSSPFNETSKGEVKGWRASQCLALLGAPFARLRLSGFAGHFPRSPHTLKLRWAGRGQMQPCYDRIMARLSIVPLSFTLPLREGRNLRSKFRGGGLPPLKRSLRSRPPTEKLLGNFSAPPQGGSERGG